MNLGTSERDLNFQSFIQPVSEFDLPDRISSNTAISKTEAGYPVILRVRRQRYRVETLAWAALEQIIRCR
jgi:hypothetical protein